MPRLPQDILDEIALYLPYEKVIALSPFIKSRLGEQREEQSVESRWDMYVKEGNIVAVKWMYRHYPICRGLLDYAAEFGQLGVVQFLHSVGAKATTGAMNGAAKNGHLHVLKWLHENRTEGCSKLAMTFAARSGHLEVVKWLHENRTEGCDPSVIDIVAKNGHMKMLEWLHRNRPEMCARNAMDYAAMYGGMYYKCYGLGC